MSNLEDIEIIALLRAIAIKTDLISLRKFLQKQNRAPVLEDLTHYFPIILVVDAISHLKSIATYESLKFNNLKAAIYLFVRCWNIRHFIIISTSMFFLAV